MASSATRPHVSVREGSTHSSTLAYSGERLAIEEPEESRVGQRRPQPRCFGPFAGHDENGAVTEALRGPLPGLGQDAEALLGREPADVQDHDLVVAHVELAAPARVAPVGAKVARIHAPAPDHRARDASRDQLVSDAGAGRVRHDGGAVEPHQPAPHQRLQHAAAVVPRVLREIRVERRHERHVVALRPAASQESQRAFRCHVDQIGLERIEEPGQPTS